MKVGVVDKLLHYAAPLTMSCIMRIWFATCRVKVYNGEALSQRLQEKKPIVASFWHYSLVFLLFFERKTQCTAMVSASKDGDYIAELARRLGFSTVRGSSNKKGAKALIAILRAVMSGSNAALVADGSQGPERIAHPGVILLASRTGVPIVPIAWSASHYFTIRSWDRTVIPKPFSRIHYFYGESIVVPGKLSQEQTETYRQLLERRLNSLYHQAWHKVERLTHYD